MEEEKLDARQISNLLKVSTRVRAAIEHKYKNSEMSEKKWKSSLKKDGFSF